MATIGEGLLKAGEAIGTGLQRRKKKARLADIVNSLQGLEDATAVGNLGNASSKLEDVIGSVEDIDELSDVLSVFKSVKSLSQPAGTPKERALGAIGQGSTLPGLSLDETKKLAGVSALDRKITATDIQTLGDIKLAGQNLSLKDFITPGATAREKAKAKFGGIPEDILNRFVSQFEGLENIPSKGKLASEKTGKSTKINTILTVDQARQKGAVGFDEDKGVFVDEDGNEVR